MYGWLNSIGYLLGFGTAAGVRPALTLVILGLISRLDVTRLDFGPDVGHPFVFLRHWPVIIAFAVLAIFESKFDNVPSLDRIQDRLLMPWRVVGGAIAGGAVMRHGTLGLVIGLVVGAAVAWLGQSVKHGTRPAKPPSGLALALISLSEDLFTFIGAIATALFGLLGYLFFCINVWLYVRLRRRRRQKYKGLRVLRE